mmetsp:Transcript_8038/g.19432  ORF Transcript_8038/g.19432 Transcript_8038/m.19432 type:complete len:252 (+) Transcript_8038:431-1186(+)
MNTSRKLFGARATSPCWMMILMILSISGKKMILTLPPTSHSRNRVSSMSIQNLQDIIIPRTTTEKKRRRSTILCSVTTKSKRRNDAPVQWMMNHPDFLQVPFLSIEATLPVVSTFLKHHPNDSPSLLLACPWKSRHPKSKPRLAPALTNCRDPLESTSQPLASRCSSKRSATQTHPPLFFYKARHPKWTSKTKLKDEYPRIWTGATNKVLTLSVTLPKSTRPFHTSHTHTANEQPLVWIITIEPTTIIALP